MKPTQHRGVVVARNGVIAASQPLAVSAGLQMLQAGGTFADAAIAASAVLCVTEPYASQLGGDAFLIVHDAAHHDTFAINASGPSPSGAGPDQLPDGIPIRGFAAATVPGLVDAWFKLHERCGSLAIDRILAPAIRYAGEGFPAGFRYCRAFANNAALLRQYPETLLTLTGSDQLPMPGAAILQPALAATLRGIAEGGPAYFYGGPAAEAIVHASSRRGGFFSKEDFAHYACSVEAPIEIAYRGLRLYGQPPPSQGHILLQELNLVEGFDLAPMGHNSAEAIHVQVEAKKLAFADKDRYLADPGRMTVGIDQLLSKQYAASRRGRIDPNHAARDPQPGAVEHDTTYFCVADGRGSAVSFIQSVFFGFGCGDVVPDAGILLNNRMNGFSPDPASVNALKGGVRPVHTLNAWLATRTSPTGADEVAWVGGTPGGDIQVQSNLQVLNAVIDFGCNVQEAVEAPRWQHGPATPEPGGASLGELQVEEGVGPEAIEGLRQRGHRVRAIPDGSHGSCCQLIARDEETGAWMAGSDWRCDGHAAGF
ncbi:MAG: gamma-glutamyltransferase family protein [Armatimonadetes bacterium]|nr:gamma-glutamyltransferase family protein [Armatimonadota bacterium]MDE2205345.1 gamma-glutamyltransferase family protein [Armatimonadota bacterium]